MGKLGVWLLGLGLASGVAAETVTLTVADLERAARVGGETTDAYQAVLAERLRQSLNEANLSLRGGQAIYTTVLLNEPLVEPRCLYSAELRRLDVSVALPADTRITMDLMSLREPITIRIQTVAALATDNGRVEQVAGLPFFNDQCLGRATYSFDVDVTARLALDLELEVAPNVSVQPTGAIRVTPSFRLTGQATPLGYRVDVDDTIWDSVLESALTRILDDYLRPRNQALLLADLERDLYRRVELAWGAPYVEFELPELAPAQLGTLQAALADRLTFPVTARYLADNQRALLSALFSGDDAALRQLLGGPASCDASRLLQQDRPYRPLYAWRDGACGVADPRRVDGAAMFTDAACRDPVAFRSTDFADYCLETLEPSRHGNASTLGDDPEPWTLWPAQQFDIALVSTAELNQPYMTRLRYKGVAGPRGVCALEMRVYTPSPRATGLRPLLLLHGGSWTSRTLGVVAQEAMLAHYTERGFAVFAPFYRLTGEGDGETACTGVTGAEVEADVSDALTWVLANQARFGASGDKVWLSGQSAGGHLAAWLAVNRAEQVERALLFYPPVDFADFLARVRAGDPGINPAVFPALERYIGQPLATVALTDPVVFANSFPLRIAAQPAAFPPLFIIHGTADATVPVSQSERLCNALAGDPAAGSAPRGAGVTQALACDARGSALRLIAGGGHALDACVIGDPCGIGGDAGVIAARAAVREGYDWLARPASETVVAEFDSGRSVPAAGISGGGGVLPPVWLLSVVGVVCMRRALQRPLIRRRE